MSKTFESNAHEQATSTKTESCPSAPPSADKGKASYPNGDSYEGGYFQVPDAHGQPLIPPAVS
jgi:hypothetical protein